MSGNQITGQFRAIIAKRDARIEELEREIALLDARGCVGLDCLGRIISRRDKRIKDLEAELAAKKNARGK